MASNRSVRTLVRNGCERTDVRQQSLHVSGQRLMGRCDGSSRGDEHEQVSVLGHAGPTASDDLPQAAPRTIALHRPTHTALAGDETHTTRLSCRWQHQQQATKTAVGHPLTPHARIVASAGQTMCRLEPLRRLIAHRHGGKGGWHRQVRHATEGDRAGPPGSHRVADQSGATSCLRAIRDLAPNPLSWRTTRSTACDPACDERRALFAHPWLPCGRGNRASSSCVDCSVGKCASWKQNLWKDNRVQRDERGRLRDSRAKRQGLWIRAARWQHTPAGDQNFQKGCRNQARDPART